MSKHKNELPKSWVDKLYKYKNYLKTISPLLIEANDINKAIVEMDKRIMDIEKIHTDIRICLNEFNWYIHPLRKTKHKMWNKYGYILYDSEMNKNKRLQSLEIILNKQKGTIYVNNDIIYKHIDKCSAYELHSIIMNI